MLDEMCPEGVIDKTRYRIKVGEHVWEVDEFHGDNQAWWSPKWNWTARTSRSSDRPGSARKSPATPDTYNSALSRTPYGQR